jgi:hypothetical protein
MPETPERQSGIKRGNNVVQKTKPYYLPIITSLNETISCCFPGTPVRRHLRLKTPPPTIETGQSSLKLLGVYANGIAASMNFWKI